MTGWRALLYEAAGGPTTFENVPVTSRFASELIAIYGTAAVPLRLTTVGQEIVSSPSPLDGVTRGNARYAYRSGEVCIKLKP